MIPVESEVYLIARPSIDVDEILTYLERVGGECWLKERNPRSLTERAGELLAEFAGRLCYRSWKPGLNPNVRKVRADQGDYLRHVLESRHGSILEHLNYSFVFANVSRVFTHELVRHRAGVAISQESLRFVRLDEVPFWIPDWAREDTLLMDEVNEHLRIAEKFQRYLAGHFTLDTMTMPFSERKAKTSFMRRFAPEGVATSIMWTANARTLRHVIEARTDSGAEEEIRLVFGTVAEIMKEECPTLFGDFECRDDGSWVPEWSKV